MDLPTVSSKSFQSSVLMKVGCYRLQELELLDIDESEYRAMFHEIPELWRKSSGLFDLGLNELFGSFAELADHIFGVHLYYHPSSSMLFVILTEYLKDTRVAVFRINAVTTIRTIPKKSQKEAEVRFGKMLEKLTYEDLEMYSVANQYLESDEIFVCPKCKARYMMRTLGVSADGKIQCQNCLSLFDPNEIHGDTSHDS